MNVKLTRIKLSVPIFVEGHFCAAGSVVEVPDHVARARIGLDHAVETTEALSRDPSNPIERAINPAPGNASRAVAPAQR